MLLSSIVALSPAPRIVHRASPIVASESLAVTTSKAAIGLAAAPVTWASLATLATTGCGLRGELAGTAEGVAYVVVAGFAATTAYTRITTGTGLAEAECAAAESEMAVLEAAGASDEQKRLSAEKAAALADGPANLLGACGRPLGAERGSGAPRLRWPVRRRRRAAQRAAERRRRVLELSARRAVADRARRLRVRERLRDRGLRAAQAVMEGVARARSRDAGSRVASSLGRLVGLKVKLWRGATMTLASAGQNARTLADAQRSC